MMNVSRKIFQQLSAVTLFVAFSLPTMAEEILLDKIVAVINDEVVMASELESRAAEIFQRLQAQGTEIPPRDAFVPQVLERLILERIQLLKGRQAGIRFSDAEVNQSIENLAKRENMTMTELVEQAHDSGTKLSTLRQQVRNQLIISRVQEGSINRRISISEQSIDNFLNSEEGRSWSSPDVELGHILLALSAGASLDDVEKVQEKARDVYLQAQNGADFKSLAIANSSGQKALQGGDLGWRKATQLPDLFISAIKNLSPGQVSEPIRSDAGYHLLKLYNRRGGEGAVVQQHNVRHILLSPNEIRSDEETLGAINKLREEIQGGKDFAVMAKEHSEDIGSAMSGGSLGWSVPGQFVPQFEATMNDIDIGQVSEPFHSQFGWHILQVTERREQDFSENIKRSQAKNILKQRKFQEELQIWLQEIRDEAFVEIKS
jgi:peptidyl-prolyl cis-trans isomerase SurA